MYGPPDLNWNMHSVSVIWDEPALVRGLTTGANASAAWYAANLCMYLPLYINRGLTVSAFWCFNGSTVSGNISMGLYDEAGSRLQQTGVVAQAGANGIQQPSITAFSLAPGRYWIGLACASASATIRQFNTTPITTDAVKWLGIGEETVSAGQVPATMTPVASARGPIPMFGLRVVSQAF